MAEILLQKEIFGEKESSAQDAHEWSWAEAGKWNGVPTLCVSHSLYVRFYARNALGAHLTGAEKDSNGLVI